MARQSTDHIEAVFDEPTGRFDLLVAVSGLHPGHDFRNHDLRGINFSKAVLSGFDFTGSDLRGTKLREAAKVAPSVVFDGVKLDDEDRHWLTRLRRTPEMDT